MMPSTQTVDPLPLLNLNKALALGPAPCTGTDGQEFSLGTCTGHAHTQTLICNMSGEFLYARGPRVTSSCSLSSQGSPQATRCQSALTHPPCHRAWTDGSYSYYLTFIKRPQCARSCVEQGCGWSQRVCPQKPVATWKGGSRPPFSRTSPTLPQLLPSYNAFCWSWWTKTRFQHDGDPWAFICMFLTQSSSSPDWGMRE